MNARKETDKQVATRCLTQLRRLPEGEELYQALINYCGVTRGVFSPEGPYQTAYNAGKHSVGIWLKSMDEDTDPNKK